jgi:hypothetical protein
VRLYEKLEVDVWEDLGLFHLVDGWTEHDGRRTVVKLALDLVPGPTTASPGETTRGRRPVPRPVPGRVRRRAARR